MENINNFLNFCYTVGVNKSDTFQTVDLYEAQNMQQVVLGIHALSRAAHAKGLTSHVIGPKLAEANPRHFTEEQLNAGKHVPSQQLGTNQGASQAGMRQGWSRQIDESPFIQ
jgi:transgelin